MFKYLSADIESTVVLNWARIANIGVSGVDDILSP